MSSLSACIRFAGTSGLAREDRRFPDSEGSSKTKILEDESMVN